MQFLDQDLFNQHKSDISIPQIDINSAVVDLNYFNNQQTSNKYEEMNEDFSVGLSCMNYYNEFE